MTERTGEDAPGTSRRTAAPTPGLPDHTLATGAVSDLAQLTQRLWGSFLGRCVRRFLAMAGIDRCVMLSSQAFTALIPLLILIAALAPSDSQDVVASSIVRRFHLDGDAASAVVQLFDVPGGAEAGGVGLFSALLLLASGTSFARRMQKMYRAAWDLEKAGVRSGVYAALGLLVLLVEVLVLYLARAGVAHLPLSWLLTVPLSLLAGLVLWTSIPYLLLDRRVHWRRLVPGAAVAAIATSAYSVATTLYMPGLVEHDTQRFGLFGITIALIGWLLAIAAIVVGSAAVGAEFDATQAGWAVALRTRLQLDDPELQRPEPTVEELEAGLNPDDLRLLFRVLASWLLLAAAVWVATAVVPGITVDGGFGTYLVASLVLGLLNALLGAVPRLVEVPFPTLAVALLSLALNAGLLLLTAGLSDGLQVSGVGAALLGGVAVSVAGTLLEVVWRPVREQI